jgi:hypothetical protein
MGVRSTDGAADEGLGMTKRHPKQSRFAYASKIAVCIFVLSAWPAAANAQRAIWSATPVGQTNGAVIKMPLKRPASRSSNLTLSIDTRWTQNYGYRPVEVTISSRKPVTADRTISIKLYSGWAWNGNMRVEQEFRLPSGSMSASTTVLMPQYQAGMSFYFWDLRVDGYLDRDLSLKQEDAYGISQGGYSGVSGVSFLSTTTAIDQRQLVSPNNMEFEVLSLNLKEFPKRWLSYTCLDAATVSLDELINLKQSSPDAFQALRFWIRAGGQLWVNEVGADFERLPELSKLLQLRASVSPNVELSDDSPLERQDDGEPQAGWRPLKTVDGSPDGQVMTFMDQRDGTTRTVRNPRVIERLQNDPNFSVISQRFDTTSNDFRPLGRRLWGKWFVEQPLGLGMVRAFRETNDVTLFQQSPAANVNAGNQNVSADMPPALRMALDSVGRWGSRHGTVPDDANVSFSDLLVPGMGLAPVTEFQVLITLFVVGIGPVNYFLLKRWRRLHLMVLTVPLAAGVVTLALFAYAFLADGFGTTVRANTYTSLDQRTGEAACWSRLSYYSGLAPRSGLTMPDDVAVYPIVPDWNGISIESVVNSKRDLRWAPDEARMTRGWLRSRTPTQYLTVRARTSPIKLEFTPVRDRLRVKNSLNTGIDYLVVADDAGKFWSAEKLANGSLNFLQPVERLDAVDRFRKIVAERSPQTPDALVGTNPQSSFQRRQWMAMRGRYSGYSGNETIEANLANASIATLAGTDGREGLALPPRSYVAVTQTGPEVVFGMDGVLEDASFHVIAGQW